MIYKYVSYKYVLNKLYRDLNLTTEINESHVISWISECLDKIGSYYQYEEITKQIELRDGKAELPINFDKLIYVTYNNKPLSWSTSNKLHYASDNCKVPTCCTDNYFYINNSFIITDIKNNDCISLTYLGMVLDDDGYPLIPELTSFLEACSKYITYMLDYREWRKGNVPDKVLDKSEEEYLWYITQAKGDANSLNIHQMERLKNIWVRLLPQHNEFKDNFKNLGEQERKFRH
jgi:hypothetical protein